ncbi:hypothetical protein COO55_23230 [Rhodococcus opacus]|nr:hypothetical protein COO55_23230 [Rhodococcus opacus]
MFGSKQGDSPFGELRALDGNISRRSMLKYLGLGTAAVGATSLLAACGGGPGAGASGQAAKFTIGSFPGDTFLLDAVNLANNDFARNNLNVPKFITPQSGVQALQLVSAGAVNGYSSDTLLLMGAHANSTQGKRPVIIGLKNVSTTYGVVVGPNGNWPGEDATFEEKMQSLKGKSIGVSAIGAGGDLQLDLALELAGMQSSDVTHLAVGPSASAIPNMKAGRLDGYVSVQWSSGLFIARETGGSVLLDFGRPSMPETLRNQAVVCISTSESFAEEHEDVLKNWLRAQSEGSEWMLSHKDDAAEILNSGTFDGNAPEIAKAYIEHYAQDVAPKLQPMFKAPKDQVDHMIDLAVRFGNAKEGAISYEQIVPAFARA